MDQFQNHLYPACYPYPYCYSTCNQESCYTNTCQNCYPIDPNYPCNPFPYPYIGCLNPCEACSYKPPIGSSAQQSPCCIRNRDELY